MKYSHFNETQKKSLEAIDKFVKKNPEKVKEMMKEYAEHKLPFFYYEKFWSRLTSLIVLAYITIGAGYEIYLGLTTHHVKPSLLFSGLSAFIFICRIGYGITSGAKGTLKADIYGACILTLLTILKIIYPN